jgi:hypothetical protein
MGEFPWRWGDPHRHTAKARARPIRRASILAHLSSKLAVVTADVQADDAELSPDEAELAEFAQSDVARMARTSPARGVQGDHTHWWAG